MAVDERKGDFLGVGTAFPFQIDERGWIAPAHYETDIEDAIRLILLTDQGERVMRPDFGADLGTQVFANMSDTTLGTIQSNISGALTEWEPRIKVLSVKVSADQRHVASLVVSIDYQVRTTNSVFNMVVPYALPGGDQP